MPNLPPRAEAGPSISSRVSSQIASLSRGLSRTWVVGCAYVRKFPTETFAMFVVYRPRVNLLVYWKIMRLSYGVPFALLAAPKGSAYEQIAYRLNRPSAVCMWGNARPG